jgi:hypothetical protein
MIFAALIAPFVCGFTVVSAPSTNVPATWSPASVGMHRPAGHPVDITDGSDVTAITAAYAAWNHVSCATFRFTDAGVDPGGAQNTIEYVTNSGDFSSPDVLAYTVRSRTGNNWTGAVVRFNDFSSTIGWATNGKVWVPPSTTAMRAAYDFQSTLTHELGHVLGLGHSADPQATMYFAGRQGRTYFRTVGDDDVRGDCYLYPAGAPSCASDADCPLQDATQGGAAKVTVCKNSACVVNKRPYGEDCFNNLDCVSGVCARFDNDNTSTDPGQCSQDCTSAACPSGDVCNSAHKCAPRAADCAPGCTGDYACLPSVDGGFTCTKHCYLPVHACDDADEICFNGVSDQEPGLCRVPGPKKTGLLCDAPGECASLICDSGSDGRQTCIGTELATPTVTTDPPPPPDSGGDGGGDGDGDGSADGGDEPLNDGNGGRASGGCAESVPSFAVVAFAVILALRFRRR